MRTNAFDKAQLLQVPGLEYLFVFHHDGRIREHALLRMSGGLPNPFLFAAVVWRLNDWAAPVRNAATRCAERSFPDTAPEIVAGAAVVLLTRLMTWSRWGDERLQVDAAFSRTDVGDCLADLIIRGRTGALATTLRYALRSSALDRHLDRIARDGVQPAVRAAALDTLINQKATWPSGYTWEWVDKSIGRRRFSTAFAHRDLEIATPRNELIARGVRDPSPAVRRVALDGVLRHLLGTAEARAFAALLAADRSPSVRARAAFILR